MTSAGKQQRISSILLTLKARTVAEEDRKAALDILFTSMLHRFMTGQVRVVGDEVTSTWEVANAVSLC